MREEDGILVKQNSSPMLKCIAVDINMLKQYSVMLDRPILGSFRITVRYSF